MESFLGKVAQFIKENYSNTKQLTVVLPSKRASLFLKNELAKLYSETIIAPEFISISTFIEGQSSLNKIGGLDSLFVLYQSYLQTYKEGNPENFESFLKWGPSLLADFSEVDQYLIDPENIFSYVNEARALEFWNLDGAPLTPSQERYIAFWKQMGNIYKHFTSKLKEDGKATNGFIYRDVASNLDKIEYQNSLLFVGFNVLTNAEERIIRHCTKYLGAKILWDSDAYYMNDSVQEAGHFLRPHKNYYGSDFNWCFDDLGTHEKSVKTINCTTNLAQTIATQHELNTLYQPNDGTKTAVILNDEELLLPLLYGLPQKVEAANITMGLSLKQTPISSFLSAIMEVWNSEKNGAFYFKNIQQLINHPLLKVLMKDPSPLNDLNQYLIRKNKIYVGHKKLTEFVGERLGTLLFNTQKPILSEYSKKTLQLLEVLKQTFTNSDMHKLERQLNLEYIYYYTIAARKINIASENFAFLSSGSSKLYKKLINQVVSKEKLAFLGEPLKGLQIMGMLEARLLDFDNVIMLSVNEGIIPKAKQQQSHIPFDIRREFSLPTHVEQDAVYSYQFYRLLQRAKNIRLLYTTGNNDFGASNEKSRLVEQIELELAAQNPKVQLEHINFNPNTSLSKSEVEIPVSAEVKEAIFERLKNGISPSGLNTLIQCPLDFYYKYILNLGEMDEVEEKLKHSTFGTCVHNVLELLYEDLVDQELTQKHIQAMQPKIQGLLENEFYQFVDKQDLKTGNNLISFEVAKRYIENFLKLELEKLVRLQKEGKSYKIVQLEQKLETTIPLELDGQTVDVKLKGIIDRVEQIGDTLYVVDYKTGKVTPSDLSAKATASLFEESTKSKALQLWLYAYLYNQNNTITNGLTAGIYSFRNFKAGFMHLKVPKAMPSIEQINEETPLFLKSLLEAALFNQTELMHNEKSKFCEYC